MKTQKLLAVFLACLIFVRSRLAQTCYTCRVNSGSAPSVEESRIARLAGFAKVWGAVKFFHPYLAYREIDWDKALIETLPKVSAAKTPEEYQAAINQMFTVLGDPSTRAEIESKRRLM